MTLSTTWKSFIARMEVLNVQFSLNVEGFDTLKNVKEKIAEQVGILPNQQRLIHFDHEFLEDGKTLHDYGIIKNVVSSEKYDMENKMKILVKNIYDKTFPIDVFPYETIYNVKEKIKSIEGTHPDKQRLVISRKFLLDEHPISCLLYTSPSPRDS